MSSDVQGPAVRFYQDERFRMCAFTYIRQHATLTYRQG